MKKSILIIYYWVFTIIFLVTYTYTSSKFFIKRSSSFIIINKCPLIGGFLIFQVLPIYLGYLCQNLNIIQKSKNLLQVMKNERLYSTINIRSNHLQIVPNFHMILTTPFFCLNGLRVLNIQHPGPCHHWKPPKHFYNTKVKLNFHIYLIKS